MTIITSERLLKSEYEVIVIGAGLGGLTATSLLAKRGVDVLLVEQHYLPGGACTSFVRDDRIFDAGAALIFGFGQTGYNIHHDLMNYLEEQVTVIPRDKFWRLDFAGESMIFWKDLEMFLKELERLFESEKDEIRALYGFLIKFYQDYIEGKDMLTPPSELSNSAKLKMFFSSPFRTLKLLKLLSMSAYDLMIPYLKSQNLVEFFDKLCGSYAYTSMKETPAMMALTMFTDNHNGGTYYVAGSAQTYTSRLEKAIERNGGTVLYESLVDKIEFEDGKASGVKLSDGTVIRAKRVVSDATVWNLYHKLIPQDLVTEAQKNCADSMMPTYPAMVLYAAVDRKVFPEDINAVEYYVRDLSQIEMGDITLYIPSVDDFSLGPPDEHIITMFSPSPNQNWPRPFEAGYQTPSYEEEKKKRAELILDEVEKRIPDFRSGIRQLHIATPSTIERYTLKNWGCVGGPKQMIGQDLTRRLPARTPWSGVFACGDSTTMGMGMPAATASGFGAANVVLRDLGKKEFNKRTFDHEFVTYIESNPKPIIPSEIDNNPENAKLIARECQHCEDQVCRRTCPAGIDIGGFIRRIEVGNFTGAAKLVREKNPLAEICGYVCDKECERVCNRLKFDSKPVQIRELHRWVSEYAGHEGYSPATAPPNGKHICVIGAGPAGITCAHYLARLGYDVELKDSDVKYGGYLKELVEQGKLPLEVLERELASVLLPQIAFEGDWVFSEDILPEIMGKYDAVYLTVESSLKASEGGNVEGMLNVFVSGGSYTNDKPSFEVVDAVSDGRKAAIAIHHHFKDK
ncbi:MAG: FAD-binding protein [Candidatus Thorarchaeota archaeon]|nr:MAG: FAD-binding protein [Candidatus Thorarchaeota archaeon]